MDFPEDKSTVTPHSFERTVISTGICPVTALQPSTATLIPYTSLPGASWRSRPRNTLMFALAEARTLPVVRQLAANMAWFGGLPARIRGRSRTREQHSDNRVIHRDVSQKNIYVVGKLLLREETFRSVSRGWSQDEFLKVRLCFPTVQAANREGARWRVPKLEYEECDLENRLSMPSPRIARTCSGQR
jgi:hypothetical protein